MRNAHAWALLGLVHLARTSGRSAPPEGDAARRRHDRTGTGIALLYGRLQLRRLRRAWRRVRNRRKLRHAMFDMDERLMKDIGLPAEQIRAVLARRYTSTGKDFC